MTLVVDVGGSFEDAVAQYEVAVPPYPAARFEQLIAEKAPWTEVSELTDLIAVNGFLIYFKFAADPLMGLAGNDSRCRVYLMGNHVIAERMYRHDPIAMLYAPLRTVISQVDGEPVKFTIDQPSREFAAIGELDVGRELDRKVAHLLEVLGWPVPSELVATARG